MFQVLAKAKSTFLFSAPSLEAIKNKASIGQEHLKPPKMFLVGENDIKSAFFFRKKFIYKIAMRNNSLQNLCKMKEKMA